MKKNIIKSTLSVLLAIMIVVSATVCAFAANSKDVIVIYDINLTDVSTPYAGEKPNYNCSLNTDAYYLSDQIDDDYDVVNGKWWYDETTQRVVQPDETFIEGHDYTINILLCASDGYEFRVDADDKPIVRAKVNGEIAIVDEDYTKYLVVVEYTFKNCDYNPIVNKVELDVTEPVTGEYPDFYPELLTEGVKIGDMNSPYYIEGVAWYDYTTQTFMNFSDKFKEGHVYEINVVVEALEDAYFPTDMYGNSALVGYVNGNKAITETAGDTGKYYARICYAFGDNRQEVTRVDVTGVTAPSVGANPDFTVADTARYNINGVFWTDITTSSHKWLEETDVFEVGHTYELEVWLRTNDGYKFKTDLDGWIDISATIGGKDAEVILPGSEVSAILSVTYTLDDFKLGDVDCSGEITILDATQIQLHIASLIELSGNQLKLADTDKTGDISIMDATAIQLYIAKLITEF